jgi:glycogen debranching enzyme
MLEHSGPMTRGERAPLGREAPPLPSERPLRADPTPRARGAAPTAGLSCAVTIVAFAMGVVLQTMPVERMAQAETAGGARRGSREARSAPAGRPGGLAWIAPRHPAVGLAPPQAAAATRLPPRFARPSSGLEIVRHVRAGAFFDVTGRRAAVFGYEDRPLEVWVYPLEVLDGFRLAFSLEGYPLPIDAREIAATIRVRPEATEFTYAHAAFTVRHVLFAPVDEPAVAMLLEIDTTLPLTVHGAFRPRLRPMWPAGAMTPYAAWDQAAGAYVITEESGRFAAVVGSPGARDVSLMPYQEEPRDVPIAFVREISPEEARKVVLPIVIAGSVEGRAAALAAYGRLLENLSGLYERTTAHYRSLLARTTDIDTPDDRLDEAFRWAKVGIDKGFVDNPWLGRGLVAGFRTAGESERPGFAWYFGRDALWTALALTAYGDFDGTRAALEFLTKHQRADGKVPHEVSQSAMLVPWFTDYPYPWASADATPLFIVAHADYWQASGDRAFLERQWEAVRRAYRFSAATDADGDGLIENTAVGHGWVEGGALYPPHEEIYLQGVWMAALEGLAAMAGEMQDSALAKEARERAARVRAEVERQFWIEEGGFYAFATALPKKERARAEPGPARERRQRRLDALQAATLVAEDTVLPAVPLWWGLLDPGRAERQIDRLGAGAIATDWGARLLSERSELYDPLSYHYGSVWPLFTGWAAMAAYRYGRPHVGRQALVANALLTFDGAAGYVTELLSGEFNTPFGRSSHHQVWSQAMMAKPLLGGLFGVEVSSGGRLVRLAPHLPASWDRASIARLAAGTSRFDVRLERRPGVLACQIDRRLSEDAPSGRRPPGNAGAEAQRVVFAPALPLDARVRGARANGRALRPAIRRVGDVQYAEVAVDLPPGASTIELSIEEGSDVEVELEPPAPGARSEGLRLLRVRAEPAGLRIVAEGRGRRTYAVRLHSPRRPLAAGDGVTVHASGATPLVRIAFEGPPDTYVRREILLPLARR